MQAAAVAADFRDVSDGLLREELARRGVRSEHGDRSRKNAILSISCRLTGRLNWMYVSLENEDGKAGGFSEPAFANAATCEAAKAKLASLSGKFIGVRKVVFCADFSSPVLYFLEANAHTAEVKELQGTPLHALPLSWKAMG